jgi:hypothetical protein
MFTLIKKQQNTTLSEQFQNPIDNSHNEEKSIPVATKKI